MWDQPGQCCQRGTTAHSKECSRFGSLLLAPAAGGQSPLLEVMIKSLGGAVPLHLFFHSLLISVPFLPFVLYLILLMRKHGWTKENFFVTLEGCCCRTF